MSSEVLAGEEHNMIHHLMVLYDCLSLTTHLREKRMEIDSAALRVFSLVHDTRRENDGVTDH
ncbi:hypothetical protein HY030_02230, partial [Candidatus Gottesmanbacteria bacterium]|nr:hypothetical protein [Candidatus Gottesmanbacteria bacterium]